MLKSPDYIIAHNRDRDFYQVALALHEQRKLRCLVTDYYHDKTSMVKSALFSSVLGHRQSPFLPSAKVRDTRSAVALQIPPKFGFSLGIDWMHYARRRIGKHVLKEARLNPDCDLLLYSTVAEEAFSSTDCVGRKRHLFLFHPHPKLISEILRQDYETYGIGKESLKEETGIKHRIENLDREIALADHVICASSFSRRSVQYCGLSNAPISVVPYGALENRIKFFNGAKAGPPYRYLFVGQAIQRKGVHHLLRVWRKLKPKNAELILVCSRVQDDILRDLPDGVIVKPYVDDRELRQLFLSTHCFLLPSLIEGFGLVLLEALQAGCYSIFSDATGFVDCDLPNFAGASFRAGDLGTLEKTIEDSLQLMASQSIDYRAISELAGSLSMARFREGIRQAVAAPGLVWSRAKPTVAPYNSRWIADVRPG